MNDTENKPQPAPETLSRRLIRACDRAVLSTAMPDGAWPYGSLVMTACDHAAKPLLLISGLAEHTKNIDKDSRASLLFDGTAGLDSPLTGARVTVLGTLSRTGDPALAARYLARHPESDMFVGFDDFAFHEMSVTRAHIVAGFGVIQWFDAEEILFDTAGCQDLAAAENDIVSHMNQDHADTVALYATSLLGLEAGDWKMTGIDPEGCDLRDGGAVARLDFESQVGNAEEARSMLVRLVKDARASGSS